MKINLLRLRDITPVSLPKMWRDHRPRSNHYPRKPINIETGNQINPIETKMQKKIIPDRRPVSFGGVENVFPEEIDLPEGS